MRSDINAVIVIDTVDDAVETRWPYLNVWCPVADSELVFKDF